MRFLYIFVMIGLVGCAGKSVRQEDVESWKGVQFSELESHPVYSTMELKKTELSTGETLYDYVNSNTHQTQKSCFTNAYGYTSCSGGGMQTVKCNHQFFVKNNVIVKYRPLGVCYTDCSRRPESRTCKK